MLETLLDKLLKLLHTLLDDELELLEMDEIPRDEALELIVSEDAELTEDASELEESAKEETEETAEEDKTDEDEFVLCGGGSSPPPLPPPQATKLKLNNSQTPCFNMFIAVSQSFSLNF